jgi:hypothetical protein
MKKLRKMRRCGWSFGWKHWLLLAVLVVLMTVWWLFIGFKVDSELGEYNSGHNAVWLGHRWVGQATSDAEVRDLVTVLIENEIDTVFLHSGPLLKDGSINEETYAYASLFLERARAFEEGLDAADFEDLDDKEARQDLRPTIQYQAWLGQLRGKLDLDNEKVRAQVVQVAMGLVGEDSVEKFDGIHFDVEPVWDEDLAFINLLEETRKALDEEIKISVALAEFIPRTLVWASQGSKDFKNYNSEVNYKNVAKHADQVVVMTYDTGFDDADWYQWLVQEQVVWVTRLLSDTEVFIGIPSYNEASEAFDPRVENIRSGARGVHEGLRDVRSDKDNFAGIAIYSYWETGSGEWEDWRALWLGR